MEMEMKMEVDNTLQHTATHCNILPRTGDGGVFAAGGGGGGGGGGRQHTATYCNEL